MPTPRRRREAMLRRLIPWYLRRARHPFKAWVVGHYWGWFSREPVWIRYDGGLLFKADLRDYVQETIFREGYYEPVVISWLERALRPGDVFWDVGANVGAMSLYAAKRCRKVYAFEPEPRSRARLEEHVAVNGLGNVAVLPVALAAADGRAFLEPGPPTNTGMSRLCDAAGRTGAIEVATRRADSLLAEGACEAPNVMKVDVEGAEARVFEGAGGLLRSPALRAIVFEAAQDAHGALASEAVARRLADAGLRVQALGPSDPQARTDVSNFVATRA